MGGWIKDRLRTDSIALPSTTLLVVGFAICELAGGIGVYQNQTTGQLLPYGILLPLSIISGFASILLFLSAFRLRDARVLLLPAIGAAVNTLVEVAVNVRCTDIQAQIPGACHFDATEQLHNLWNYYIYSGLVVMAAGWWIGRVTAAKSADALPDAHPDGSNSPSASWLRIEPIALPRPGFAVGIFMSLATLASLPFFVSNQEIGLNTRLPTVVFDAIEVVTSPATVALFVAAFVIRKALAALLPIFEIALFILTMPGMFGCLGLVQHDWKCDFKFGWEPLVKYVIPSLIAVTAAGWIAGSRSNSNGAGSTFNAIPKPIQRSPGP